MQILFDRDEDGYFDHVYSFHFPTEKSQVVEVNERHTVYEVGTEKHLWMKSRGLNGLRKLLYLAELYRQCAVLIQTHPISILKTHDPYFGGFVGWLLARRFRLPFCVSLRTPADLRYRLEGPTVLFPTIAGSRGLAKKLESFVLKRADRVMARSQNLAEDAVQSGARKDRIRVDRFGIETAAFLSPVDPDFVSAQGLSDRPWVVHVGRLNKENYIDDVIEVAGLVISKRKDVVFLIVGDGPERKTLEERVQSDGLEEYVRFLGVRPHAEVAEFRKNAAVNLGLMAGNSLAEAACAGRPVISYDVDWHGELIRNGETGFLCKEYDTESVAEHVLELLDNPQLADRLGAACRQLALQNHRRETIVNNRRRFYDELLASSVS